VPFPAGTFRSIFSNSVLEHTEDPRAVLLELNRVLITGGSLCFTVTTSGFTDYVAKYLGRRESVYRNRYLDHKHLHPPDWWHATLADAGFSIEVSRSHAPEWFTFSYLVAATGVVSRLLKWGLGTTRFYHSLASKMVRSSIQDGSAGANLFILAKATKVRP
jgi:SAM-dependent methyltransferase